MVWINLSSVLNNLVINDKTRTTSPISITTFAIVGTFPLKRGLMTSSIKAIPERYNKLTITSITGSISSFILFNNDNLITPILNFP